MIHVIYGQLNYKSIIKIVTQGDKYKYKNMWEGQVMVLGLKMD
jgi:hypothetical protein